jgi:hypothetical protein
MGALKEVVRSLKGWGQVGSERRRADSNVRAGWRMQKRGVKVFRRGVGKIVGFVSVGFWEGSWGGGGEEAFSILKQDCSEFFFDNFGGIRGVYIQDVGVEDHFGVFFCEDGGVLLSGLAVRFWEGCGGRDRGLFLGRR